MNAEEQAALDKIRAAVDADHLVATTHFDRNLAKRGLFWSDLLTIIEFPIRMENQGMEDHGWPKWRIWGKAVDGSSAAVVVALQDDGHLRLITIHWED